MSASYTYNRSKPIYFSLNKFQIYVRLLICIDTYLRTFSGSKWQFLFSWQLVEFKMVNNNHVVQEYSLCETYYLCKINHDHLLYYTTWPIINDLYCSYYERNKLSFEKSLNDIPWCNNNHLNMRENISCC